MSFCLPFGSLTTSFGDGTLRPVAFSQMSRQYAKCGVFGVLDAGLALGRDDRRRTGSAITCAFCSSRAPSSTLVVSEISSIVGIAALIFSTNCFDDDLLADEDQRVRAVALPVLDEAVELR